MNKSDAASTLLSMLALGVVFGWIGANLYAFRNPDSNVATIAALLSVIISSVIVLGIASLVIYCIYVLIA
ncbi:MAG: hypothetical protein KAJ19_24400 [Gammaproteobacteria bacterium]|nr:hypothetical protein [Gammaproteobacteria bacterium]